MPPNDKPLLDWLDTEMPLLIEREGADVLVKDSGSGNVLGRGATLRDAIWDAMRGEAV